MITWLREKMKTMQLTWILQTEPRSSRKKLLNVKYWLTQIKFERNAGRKGIFLCFFTSFPNLRLEPFRWEHRRYNKREKQHLHKLQLKIENEIQTKHETWSGEASSANFLALHFMSFRRENFFNVGSNILETNQWKIQVKCLSSKPNCFRPKRLILQ